MVRQRRERILRRRRAMHECHRAESRFTHRAASQGQAGRLRQLQPPDGRKLHEEIMWMLPIDEGPAIDYLSDLKDFSIPALADGEWIKTQHTRERQL